MAIVTIKYDLNQPEDRQELERTMYSLNMASFIFEVLMNGKRHFKHDEKATIDDVFQYLWEVAEENKIDIDNLIT